MAEASETSEQEDMLERALLPEKERAVLHRLVEHGEATVTLGRIIPVKRYLEPEFWVIYEVVSGRSWQVSPEILEAPRVSDEDTNLFDPVPDPIVLLHRQIILASLHSIQNFLPLFFTSFHLLH